MGGVERRTGREQMRRGIERIIVGRTAMPGHRGQPSGSCTLDMWAIGTRGAWAEDDRTVDVARMKGTGAG